VEALADALIERDEETPLIEIVGERSPSSAVTRWRRRRDASSNQD
jgi:hypothetical protein